jgi:ABC-type antimicrobial peptide transport system permease subunit
MATLQGRDELGLLRRVGATDGQVMGATAVRSLQVVLLGVVLGTAASVVAVMYLFSGVS